MIPKTLKLVGYSPYREVDTQVYIIAKTKQLKEFGYSNLTIDEVTEQLKNVYFEKPLNIIGQFIKEDIKF
jgi:hypothetical protein